MRNALRIEETNIVCLIRKVSDCVHSHPTLVTQSERRTISLQIVVTEWCSVRGTSIPVQQFGKSSATHDHLGFIEEHDGIKRIPR